MRTVFVRRACKAEPGFVAPSIPPKVSEPICFTSVAPSASPVPEVDIQAHEDVLLSTPQIRSNILERGQESKLPKNKVTIDAPLVELAFSPALYYPVFSCAFASSRVDLQSKPLSEQDSQMSYSEMGERPIIDPDSVCHKRSPLADAMSAPVPNFAPPLSEG